MPRNIRVLIADDHAAVRLGLSVFLELAEGIELIAQAENGQQAVELVEQKNPDVVLMDLMMPVMDGVTATRIIRQKFPQVQVIILTSTVEHELIDQALAEGACGYMPKDVTIDTLAATIRRAAA